MAKEVVVEEREVAAGKAEPEPTDVGTPKPLTRELALATRFAWKIYSIGWGTSVCGATYPIVFAFIACLTALIIAMSQGSVAFSAEGIESTFAVSAVATVVGFLWAMLVCICVLPIVYFFVRSLGLRGSVVRLGAFSGGLVGFIAAMPPFVVILLEGQQGWWRLATVVLLGPALTTVLGQIGGAWGAVRVGSYERAVAKDWANRQLAPEEVTETHSAASDVDLPTRFQFRIWHLLFISIWISLMLTAIRLTGIDFTFALSLIFGWAVYQEVTLRLGKLLAAWLGPWKARRKSRST